MRPPIALRPTWFAIAGVSAGTRIRAIRTHLDFMCVFMTMVGIAATIGVIAIIGVMRTKAAVIGATVCGLRSNGPNSCSQPDSFVTPSERVMMRTTGSPATGSPDCFFCPGLLGTEAARRAFKERSSAQRAIVAGSVMTRFVAIGVMLLIGSFTSPALAEHSAGRNIERCGDAQERARCEKLAGDSEQGATPNEATLNEQMPCEKMRGGCGSARLNRASRPPFWIGHHYSGL